MTSNPSPNSDTSKEVTGPLDPQTGEVGRAGRLDVPVTEAYSLSVAPYTTRSSQVQT